VRRECKIKVHKETDLFTIEVVGDLTASAEKAMDDAYKQVCDNNPRSILLKFDGKSRINSAGIAIVINLVMQRQGKDCKIFITGVSKHFRKIFELVGLTKFTTIVDSEEEIERL
jgi:stage II sporulation protein AA (anti-sigma F factor antagonist)